MINSELHLFFLLELLFLRLLLILLVILTLRVGIEFRLCSRRGRLSLGNSASLLAGFALLCLPPFELIENSAPPSRLEELDTLD